MGPLFLDHHKFRQQLAPDEQYRFEAVTEKADRPALRIVGNSDAPIGHIPAQSLMNLHGVATVKRNLQETINRVKNRNSKDHRWLGGLLMYGPPGCGKVFAAKVIAGEVGATIHLFDLATGWDRKAFENAIRSATEAPLNAIHLENIDSPAAPALMNSVLDYLDGHNDLVLTASATLPWQVRPELVQARRLGHVLLVLPPDAPSRADFLTERSQGKAQIATNDFDWIIEHTDGHSFTDLDRLLQHAIQLAGDNNPTIDRSTWRIARKDVPPSSSQWLTSAGHHAMMNQEGGMYDDLLDYFHMRQHH